MSEERSGTVLIDRIGHRGDGIAMTGSGPVYVPFALPGEEVVIAYGRSKDRHARLLDIRTASPERTPPSCGIFGQNVFEPCGGCSLQMMSLESNRALKRRFVADSLGAQGIEVSVDETIGANLGERRRAVLSARTTASGIVLGYHMRGSNQIVDTDDCPVLVSQIAERFAALKAVLGAVDLSGGQARLTVLSTETGLDVDIAPDGRKTRFGSLAETGRLGRLVSLCQDNQIARLTVDGELAVKLADPVITIDGVRVTPNPAAFTQPTASTETAMIGLVKAHLLDCESIVDLFAGVGTFTLALARRSMVHAVEIDQTALSVLKQAFQQASRLKRVTTERRDILRHPITSAELAGYAGLVFDPPRGGASAQAAEIAASGLRKVAAVSCNPATFARDCRTLLESGFELLRVVPVDQFVYSAETEVIGLLQR